MRPDRCPSTPRQPGRGSGTPPPPSAAGPSARAGVAAHRAAWAGVSCPPPRMRSCRRAASLRPVGALVLLVELHAEVLLQQTRQPDLRLTENLRGKLRVEEMRDAYAVVAGEKAQIVIGVVQDDLDRVTGEQGRQWRDIGDGQGIDDPGVRPGGNLKQTDPVVVAVVAGGLRVDRQEGRTAQLYGERFQSLV